MTNNLLLHSDDNSRRYNLHARRFRVIVASDHSVYIQVKSLGPQSDKRTW